MERIVVMNVAFDVLCAIVYTGELFSERLPLARPEGLKMPMMCNAFSAFAAAAGEGHYFETYGYDLTFNRRMHFDACAETSACALVVLA